MDLAAFIEEKASYGRCSFTSEQVERTLAVSTLAARAAIRRLRGRGRIATPHRGFHVIVPPEYRAIGCLPADQFVPDLMDHLGLDWYVGLLSAAALRTLAKMAER